MAFKLRTYRKYIEILFAVILLYGILFNYSKLILSVSENYHPVWSDEFFYFANTDSFIQNNTLKAALTLGGEGSILFGADPHGFGYPLLHGVIGKIFGWSNLNMIYFNFLIICIPIILIYRMKTISISQKMWIVISILSFPFFSLYAFTYMQEIIHVFTALLLSFLMYNIYQKDKEDNGIYVLLYILLIFIAGIFRSLWLFWLVGILPLAEDKKQFVRYIAIFAFGIFFSFLVNHYVYEPVPNYFSSLIDFLKKGEFGELFSSLVSNFWNNLRLYFFDDQGSVIYLLIKYVNLGVVIYFTSIAIKTKNEISISLASIGVLNFLLLFFLYDAFSWREIRTMSPLFYFYIIFIVTNSKSIIQYLQVIILCLLFLSSMEMSRERIAERNEIDVNKFIESKEAFFEIAEKIPGNSKVLISYLPEDHSLDVLNLPLSTNTNLPIHYIIQYYDLYIPSYHYVLSKPGVNYEQYRKVIDNQYYTLFKVRK
ncbi:hypothetical protein M0D21_20390 [Aquimarina sp. D1M17]|uniref:hypothetical protein n=1 Tax=Aquimarina acroporae TaxID=2937283 RepID=UPI0020BFD74A|nr:hypothetical protein [Aquimarina acroporae]MCK8523948.1 hypothetical protein [Aquimarina acroporae]